MSSITNDKHVKDICKVGQGNDCCRYLVMGTKGFECAKETSMRELLDRRVSQMTAKGDNCKGFEAEKLI